MSALHFGFFTWLVSFHEPLLGGPYDGLTTVAARAEPAAFFTLTSLLWIFSLGGLLGGVYLHFRPSHDRRVKYEWLLIFGWVRYTRERRQRIIER